jgi:hypothetical protein
MGEAGHVKGIMQHYTLIIGPGVTVPMFSKGVTVIPSDRDSDRMDIAVTVEFKDQTFHEYEYKDVRFVEHWRILPAWLASSRTAPTPMTT